MAREATIHKVNPYELHGVPYYQLIVTYADAPESLREVRLAADSVYDSPGEGDTVNIEALLSVVTAVTKKDAPAE